MSDHKPRISREDRDDRRPQPRRPEAEPTIWLDFTTGRGVNDAGQTIEPIIGGRRKKPRLIDLMETARHHHARRLMLCGAVPSKPADWLLPDQRTVSRGEDYTPGWLDDGHYLDDPPQGRFTHAETKARLAVCLVREWFPESSPEEALAPREAQFCWDTLTWVVKQAIDRDWPLMRLPGQTILNIWKLRAPASYAMEKLDPDIGQEIQFTEPQHRVEHYAAPGRCECGDCPPLVTGDEIPGFHYGDGRFMFHGAPPKELGAAPAHRMTAAQAAELFAQNAWHPARYQVSFTVPEQWDTLGLFPVKQEYERGWHWPNRPRARHTTWVDSRELTLARDLGWAFDIHEGIRFTKTNSLQFLSNGVQKMLDLVDELAFGGKPATPRMKGVIASAVQQMYRVAIGSFARRPRVTTRFAASMADIPESAVGRADPVNDGFIYRVHSASMPSDSDTWHPEIAARVWATSRVAVLNTPTAKLTAGPQAGQNRFGALEVNPAELLGITGDAIYTTTPQQWMLPVANGGGDDGRTGRIRVKGWIPGPMPTPPDMMSRLKLSHQAEERGWQDLLG